MNRRVYTHNKKDIHELICIARRNPCGKDKVIYKYGDFLLNVTPQRAIYHAYLEEVFVKNDIKIVKELVCWENYSKENAGKFPNRVLKHLLTLDNWISKELVVLNEIVSKVIEGFVLLTIIGDKVVSMDNSMSQLVAAYRGSQTFRDMLDKPAILPTDTPENIVRKQAALVETMKKELDFEPFKTLMGSGVGINTNQMKTMVVWGLVPRAVDINEMHDVPVCSGRLNGFTSMQDKLADDSAARRATILTKISTSDTGALSKAINVLVQGIKLNEADSRNVTHDCGSKHPIPINVTDSKVLDSITGKYRVDNTGMLVPITEADTHLIGTTVRIRSLATCACQTTVCEICWGTTAWANQDTSYVKYNAGAIGAKGAQAKIFQLVLSAKHHSFGILAAMYIVITQYLNGIAETKNMTMEEVPTDIFTRSYNILNRNPNYIYVADGSTIINELSMKKDGKPIGDYDALNEILTNDRQIPIRVKDILVYEKDMTAENQIGELKYKLSYEHGFRVARRETDGYNTISVTGEILVEESQTIKYVIPNIAVTEPYEKMQLLVSGELISGRSDGGVSMLSEYIELGLKSIPGTHVLDIEIIVGALMRDPKNPRFKPNWTSTEEPASLMVSARKANTIGYNTSLSRILQLGDSNRKIFSSLAEYTLPDEYDILFNCLKPRNTSKNKSLFLMMNEIIAKNEG